MTLGDFASLLVALATTGSLIYISRQVNVTRLQAKGQFLLALDAQFKEYNRITLELEGMVIRVTVKGIMKAFVALNKAESGPIMAERAACFSLKENVRPAAFDFRV